MPGEQEISFNLVNAFHQELKTRNLPVLNLVSFEENSSNWFEFLPDFKRRVHFKRSFSDNMCMERLLSVLKGEAKKSVEIIG